MGTINPIGHCVREFVTNLDAGVSGAGPITRFDPSLFKTRFACEVKDFDPVSFGIDVKTSRKQDRFSRFALAAAIEAVADSGLDIDAENKARIGVIVGSGIGGLESLNSEIIGYCDSGKNPRFSPLLVPRMITNIASGWIAIRFGFSGPNYSVSSACASSLHAISDAFNLIRMGKADVMLTGGSEAPIVEPGVSGFNSTQALSTRNDDPTGACRPFDAGRDGFVIGEGAGVLVLEELDHAVRRGATIYAEVAGTGMTCDAYHITAPEPGGEGAIGVMKLALEDAGMNTTEIDYLNAHGTSTPLGDISELKAIQAVFGENAYNLNISSTKSMHGHLLGGSGAIESIACIHAIQDSIIPPTINFHDEDPRIDYKLNLTLNVAQKREVRAAMKNSFGFGGHNACVIYKKY